MSNQLNDGASEWSRRKMLKWGIGGGLGAVSAAYGLNLIDRHTQSSLKVPPMPAMSADLAASGFNPVKYLRNFDYGTVTQENGRTVREFRLEAGSATVQLNQSTSFIVWNFNGQVPAPTLRATQGDRIRVVFSNHGGHYHTIHFHGTHPAAMDGIKPVKHNTVFIYEFDADSFGIYPYHCHIEPVTRHIGKGLYGMLIVDPPNPRPVADEMVLIMGGYDLNSDGKNELYAFNGLPNYYMHQPIPIQQDELIRIYLQNMIELDPVATFHLHANLFQIYPTGRTLIPSAESDVITMGTADRHILEFRFKYPGKFMFHPHQDNIAESGCMGFFEVLAKG
jgi:manganese oxidase